jgi:hypothetical protein
LPEGKPEHRLAGASGLLILGLENEVTALVAVDEARRLAAIGQGLRNRILELVATARRPRGFNPESPAQLD